MGLLERLRITGPKPIEQPKQAKKEKTYSAGILDLALSGLSNEKAISPKLLQAYEGWVYTNVSVLAEEVSKLEPQLFRMRLLGGKVDVVEIESHPVLDLIDKFNESTTRSDAFYVTEAHLDLAGNSFWFKQREGGEIKNLFLLQPDKVSLKLGDFSDSTTQLIEAYEFKDIIDGKRVEVSYDPTDIIPIRVPNPSNPYRGKSTVEAIAASIDISTHITNASKNFFKNNMIADFGLFTEQSLNDDQIKSLEARLKAYRTGSKNAFKVPIFSGGLKPETLKFTNKEIQLIELHQWLRDEIMAAFGNTKASLGITEDVNRANAEASLANWKRSTVVPKIKRIVDSLNEYLIPEYGDDLILGFKDPVPEDRASTIEEVDKLYVSATNPVITEEEARDLLGYGDKPTKKSFKFDKPEDMNQIPGLKYVDVGKVYRKNGWFDKYKSHKDIYSLARVAAEKIVKKPANKASERATRNFWRRLVRVVEDMEVVFDQRLVKFIEDTVEEAKGNVDNEDKRKEGELIDVGRRLVEAQAQFSPILTEALIHGGQEANRLLGINEPYIPKAKRFDITEEIRKQVELFALAMLETDREIIVDILAQGLKAGDSIPAIRKKIEEKFSTFTRTQANRITRTEVMTAANKGVLNSFEQSEVVIGKQWLAAPDPCPYCAPMHGKILPVSESYFKQGDKWQGNADSPLKLDYRETQAPPLHPNCRCTLVEVIEGVPPVIEPKGYVGPLKDIVEYTKQIRQLEQQIDRRTKAYRELKKKNLEPDAYLKELERLALLD